MTCLSADAVAHELLEPGRSCWQVIHDLDKKFIRPDQSLDKVLLRQALFNDADLRKNINEKMHPLIAGFLLEKVEQGVSEGVMSFLLEVPLLYEAGWQEMFSEVIVVYAKERKCAERVVQRDGVSLADAEKSIATQLSLREKALRADHVIDNSGSWVDTRFQLLHLGSTLWGNGP